jgi:hypothetical protein
MAVKATPPGESLRSVLAALSCQTVW